MANVELQFSVNDEVVQTVLNPARTPLEGEYIEIPDRKYGVLSAKRREVYVSKVLNRYPLPGDPNQTTFVTCQCVNV